MLNWLKSFFVEALKKVAVAIIQKEGDALQAKVRAQLDGGGDSCVVCDRIDRVIDEAQRRTLVLVASSGPTWAFLKPLRDAMAKEIGAHGDALQAKLREEIKANGPKAIDAVFDKAQALLVGRVQALQL